jgi:hypothetical protein
VGAHDQERWCHHVLKSIAGEVRSTTTAHHGSDKARPRGGSPERSGSTGAGPKQPDRQAGRLGLLAEPIESNNQAIRQPADVEAKLQGVFIDRFFLASQEIHQQRAKSSALQDLSNILIPR